MTKNIFKSKINIFLISVMLIGFGLGLVSDTSADTCSSSYCPQFNNCPQDLETLVLKNRTQGTSWQDTISANCGDRVAFQVYYHNTVEGSVAQNTKIRLDYPCNSTPQMNVTAYLWADNASYVSDTGTINASSAQGLTFDSTANWYPNQGSTPTSIYVTQVTACSVQVDIGDIQGGWPSQGFVNFEATITSCATPTPTPYPVTPTVDIKANGSDGTVSVSYNSSANLSWTSSNATSCYASGDWSGNKGTYGSESTGNLTYSRTYTITCTGSGGSASDSVTVSTQTQQNLYVSLTANPSSGCYPLNNVDLTASVSGGSYYGNITYYFDCTNDGYFERTISDSSTYYTAYDICNYYSAGTYTARVRAERSGATAENTTQVYASSACYTSTPTVDIKANGSDGTVSVSYNSSANLSWTSSNATSCYASGDWSGNKGTYGSESTGNLTYSRTYTITCTGSGGSASDSVTVSVGSSYQNASVNKLVRNVSDNTAWVNEIAANPGEFLAFSIQVTAPSNTYLSNVVLTDTLPAKIIYRGNLKIDGVSTSGDITTGLNVGTLSASQSKTVTFDAQAASTTEFPFGTTVLVNTVSVTGGNISNSDTATVNVMKAAVAGAITGISTGVNILYFVPLIILFLSLIFYFLAHYLENSRNSFVRKVLGAYYKIRMFILR